MDKVKPKVEKKAFSEEDFQASYFPPVMDIMVNEWDEGAEIGETCRIKELERFFSWKMGFINCWTGWGNDGKMEWVENLIPTPTGFKKMLDIKSGDKIFDDQGNVCTVTFVTEIKYNKKCFKVTFNDGESVVCGEEHLWLTYNNEEIRSYYTRRNRVLTTPYNDQSHKRHQPKVRTTKEISETMIGRQGTNNHAVQVCKPIICKDKNYRIHPYLLGAWLGDGASSGAIITNHEKDFEIITNIKKLGYVIKRQKSKRDKLYNYQIGEYGQVVNELKSYGIFNNKRIPSVFLFGSFEQRLSLLQGLMDTDGYINKSGQCEFCACGRPELADEVYSLICSLGIRAGITKSDAKLYGRKTSDRYRITFKTTLPVFRLKRKLDLIPKKVDSSQEFRFIVKCEPVESVPCRCIQVDSPSKLYLTGRSFIPTHNTTMFLFLTMMKAFFDQTKVVIWSPEMMSSHQLVNTVAGVKHVKVKVTANDIYNDLIWMLTGVTPYEHISKKYKVPKLTMDEYVKAIAFVEKHFYVVYPKDRTHTGIMNCFRWYYEKFGAKIFLADPFKALKVDSGERTDLMMNEFFGESKEFAIQTHSSMNYIAHPKNISEVREKGKNGEKGAYKVCDQYMLAGGQAWDNNMDGIYSIYRPERHLDMTDPKMHFINLKQRKEELVGHRGEYRKIEFERLTRKYYFDGVYPKDGSMKNAPLTDFNPFAGKVQQAPPPDINDELPF